MKIRNLSLWIKMVIGGMLVVIIAFVIVGSANFYYVSKSMESFARERATLIAKSLADHVETDLAGKLKAISMLAVDPQVVAAASAGNYYGVMEAKMKAIFQSYGSYLEGAFITDKSGIIRIDTVDVKRLGLDLSDRRYFLNARTGNPTISDAMFSRATGDPIIMLSAPIMANHQFVGVIACALKINYLLDSIGSVTLGKTGYSFMIDRNGMTIAHPRKDYILTKDSLRVPGVENVAARMTAQETGTAEYSFEGTPKMAGFAPIEITGWSVAVTQDRSEFLGPARTIISNILVFSPIALFIALILGTMIARELSQPIQNLSRAAKGLARGEWQQLPDTGRKDEIGEVVRSFNSMSEQLQETFMAQKRAEDDLFRLNQELEQRVSLRTGELTSKTTELEKALSEVKKLSGLLPICSSCKKIRDDKGYWNQIESYIKDHSEAEFSHGICPDCTKKLYPDIFEKIHSDDKP
ncbi:MAG TPA: cache domain-containing protein [Syntrophorhabdaceae bacterium]|nr:cache domain-containing protein [Syntrophorhabdaceae bacterium]